jgi:hypothetical protein
MLRPEASITPAPLVRSASRSSGARRAAPCRPRACRGWPPSCFRKKAVPACSQASRRSRAHSRSKRRQPGPDSPPQISQSMPDEAAVLDRRAEPDVRPAGAPIGREVIGDPLRALREDLVDHPRRLPDDVPRLVAPRIGRLVEEVRPRAREHEHRPALLLADRGLLLGPALRQRRVEARPLRAHDDLGVAAVAALLAEHVAVGAARAHLVAAAPRIPGGVGPFDSVPSPSQSGQGA